MVIQLLGWVSISLAKKTLQPASILSRLAQFGQIVVRAPCGENPWSLLTNLPLWRWNLLDAAFIQKQVRMAQGQRDHPRCSMTELDQSILTILESIGCYRFCWLLELPSAKQQENNGMCPALLFPRDEGKLPLLKRQSFSWPGGGTKKLAGRY